jgi:hypothetical protein
MNFQISGDSGSFVSITKVPLRSDFHYRHPKLKFAILYLLVGSTKVTWSVGTLGVLPELSNCVLHILHSISLHFLFFDGA